MEKIDGNNMDCSVERFHVVSSKHSRPLVPSLRAQGEGEAGSGTSDGEYGTDNESEGGGNA